MYIHYLLFRLDVHVYYDDSFNRRFGRSSETRIRALFSTVKTIYSDPSLTTILDPNVINISYYAGQTWEASEANLR